MKKNKQKKLKKSDYDANFIKQQAERISELKAENIALENKLEFYRKRDLDIANTIDFARKQGEEYIAAIKAKYALECDRIRRFKDRLEKFRNRDDLIKCYDTAFGELNAWLDEMENAIADDFGSAMSDYIKEKKRLNAEPELDYIAIKNRLKSDLSKIERLSEDDLKELLAQI